MRRSGPVALLLGLLITTASCGGSEPQTVATRDGKRSYQEFRATIATFPYTASRERRGRTVEGYSRLRVGMTKEEVSVAIGEPDYSQLTASKSPGPGWTGSVWMYYLSMRSDGANTSDAVVHVFFDREDRAVWIVPSNIDGLHEMRRACDHNAAPNYSMQPTGAARG